MLDNEELKYLPKPRFLRERPVMLIGDCPLELEIKSGKAHSAQSTSMLFNSLGKVGINRLQIYASYLFNFRPEKGDLSALMYGPGLPISEYSYWPTSKKDHILKFAYNDLINLKEEIKEINPSLIICTGKWALYFLTGETTLAETKKSAWGTLLKWRASHLKLHEFWDFKKPHILIPILTQKAIWNLPEYSLVINQDYTRCGILSEAAIKENIYDYTEKGQNYNFIVEPTFKQVKHFLIEELTILETKEKLYAVDVETRQGYHDCIGIADSNNSAICIPWATTENPYYWEEAEEVELVYLLMLFLSNKNCLQVGQNYWYDMQYLNRDLCVKTKPYSDTMVLQHTMFAGLEKNLAFIASLYAKYYRYWKDEGNTKAKADKDKKTITNRERWIYNCKDCCLTLESNVVLKNILGKSPVNIQNAYETQLNETLPVLVNIMNRGVDVNLKQKDILYKELREIMEEIQKELNFILDEEINTNSSPQKLNLFYDLFNLPKQYDPKTRKPTLNAQALENLIKKFPLIRPVAERIIEYGNLKTFSSTFLKAKPDIDEKMRTSYNLCGTDTFRLSSSQNAFGSGLNLQNIPGGGETITGRMLPNCRKLFIPKEGYTFFDIDLDSADLRIVVAECGAVGLQQMLDEGLKPYVEMMKEFYNDPTKTKNSPEYKTFKGIAHGTNYVGSASGLAARFGMSVHEMSKLQKWYFDRNPEIKKWHKELKKQIYKRGWIENIFGYRKNFFNKKEPTLLQIAAAWKPQSTVGLLINKGMVIIDNKYEKGTSPVEILLQVHDSLGGQYPTNKPECKQQIINDCEISLPYEKSIIIPVDIHTSEISWGHCK